MKTKMSFEQNIDRVAEIVEKLDAGGIPLGDSLELYKEAVESIKRLQNELDAAKGKIVVMRKSLDGVFEKEEVSEDEL